MRFKRLLILVVAVCAVFAGSALVSSEAGFAAGSQGLLPGTSLSTEDCRKVMDYVSGRPEEAREKAFEERSGFFDVPGMDLKDSQAINRLEQELDSAEKYLESKERDWEKAIIRHQYFLEQLTKGDSSFLADSDEKDALAELQGVERDLKAAQERVNKAEINLADAKGKPGVTSTTILACGIRTGNIKMWMIPYYIRFMLEFIVGIAGLLAVGGTVYGGYLYLFAGVAEEGKDKGKKAIMYGITGMIITLVAWAVVNIFISLLTRF